MAVLGSGMEVRAGAGVGWFQFRVAIAYSPGWVMVGLVPEGASVADGQYPGKADVAGGVGWNGRGRVCWTLPGPAPTTDTVKFGCGDRVTLVLDCRARPLVRLLVNNQLRMVHDLATDPPAILCPAVGLLGCSDGVACMELEHMALPPGWDLSPA